MDKKKEIATLQSLKGDTYFNEYFRSDMAQMCENIKNDFPIEYGCAFAAKAESLQKELNKQMVRTSDEMENIVRAFITLNKAAFTQEFYHFCCEKVGKLFIIKEKRLNGIALTDDELDYLIGVADKHINPENYL